MPNDQSHYIRHDFRTLTSNIYRIQFSTLSYADNHHNQLRAYRQNQHRSKNKLICNILVQKINKLFILLT
ncbi:hypothetical protein BET10_04700 [Pseudoalteromonas amylolytica]|uniref:Uncharacterized protein n=1 Tax=Pseudoalteromonas amylolytica TaxID=1859457 RepID=A0A1S1N2C0_9GAMM|nr:hypothetical protein BET10_04700 [Pseudoalteromonas amylolytica]